MRKLLFIGMIGWMAVSCLREPDWGEACRGNVFFKMEDVPYIFQGSDVVDYRPYYTFTENLYLYVFADERLQASSKYDYQYCREHPVIPYRMDRGRHFILFAANLYDPKELDWKFENGRLVAVFSILDHEEPPVLLTAVNEICVDGADSVGVALRMLISRLEIRVDNPPAWVTGLNVFLSNVAGSVTSELVLGDTTHIYKQLPLNNQGAGSYWTGINTFPTYPDSPALLNIQLTGGNNVATILVDDDRLHFAPGTITRLELLFRNEGQVDVSIEVDGKWEVVEGGHIII